MQSTEKNRPYRIRFFKDRLKFSSAHFTLFEDGSCEHLHGHNYRVSVEMAIQELQMGLACPFDRLKRLVEQVIRPLDEMVLIPADSSWVSCQRNAGQMAVKICTSLVKKEYSFPEGEVFLVPGDNVSSECLAAFLFHELKNLFEEQLLEISVRTVCVTESSGQEVCYTRD